MDLNVLKQYMDFATNNHLFDSFRDDSATHFNRPKMIADWAASMMGPQGGQQADVSQFFGGAGNPGGGYTPSQYVQPQRFDAPMPQRNAPQSPMRGPVDNYLAQLIGRR